MHFSRKTVKMAAGCDDFLLVFGIYSQVCYPSLPLSVKTINVCLDPNTQKCSYNIHSQTYTKVEYLQSLPEELRTQNSELFI